MFSGYSKPHCDTLILGMSYFNHASVLVSALIPDYKPLWINTHRTDVIGIWYTTWQLYWYIDMHWYIMPAVTLTIADWSPRGRVDARWSWLMKGRRSSVQLWARLNCQTAYFWKGDTSTSLVSNERCRDQMCDATSPFQRCMVESHCSLSSWQLGHSQGRRCNLSDFLPFCDQWMGNFPSAFKSGLKRIWHMHARNASSLLWDSDSISHTRVLEKSLEKKYKYKGKKTAKYVTFVKCVMIKYSLFN